MLSQNLFDSSVEHNRKFFQKLVKTNFNTTFTETKRFKFPLKKKNFYIIIFLLIFLSNFNCNLNNTSI